MVVRPRLAAAAAFAALIALAGCAGVDSKPLTYTSVGDMRPGPGLFTGGDGEFILLRKSKAESWE